MTIPFHLLPQPGQPSNILQDYNYSQNLYSQNDETVTPTPSIAPSLLNPVHRSDHGPVAYMSETDLSHMRLDNSLREAAASSFDIHTQQNQNLHHDEHQSTGLAAGESWGLPVPQRTTNEWDGSQEASASQGNSNGI